MSGHELCTADSWVNPVVASKLLSSEQAHPNLQGQIAYEQAVAKALNVALPGAVR